MKSYPMRTIYRCLLTALVFGVGGQISIASDPIPLDQFAKLHALIKPTADEEKWLETPWLVNLWEARQQAAAQGKPILLWEMDGHPLGCT
jgi:hypothetical protein